MHGALQDRVELHGLALGRHLPGKAEQVLHDLLGALRFLQNHAQIAARAFRDLGIFHQQVGKSEDGGKGIVDFVGDAGDQLPNGSHFLGVHELGAQHGGVGDVAHDYYDAADAAVFAADGAEIDGELALTPSPRTRADRSYRPAGRGPPRPALRGAQRRGGGAQVGQGMSQDLDC
jgi:hypothetical protein